MRSKTCLTPALLIAVSLSLAPGCAVRGSQSFPPSADLRGEPKPRLDPTAVDSEAALDAYEIELEAWGERGWAAVGRLCRWSVRMGAELPFECQPPPDPG